MIAIIDYGMGNIHSVQKALEYCGAKTQVTNKAKDIRIADKAILPGVGAFKDAMDELEKQDLIKTLNDHIKNKKPFLGICLGMQLLFEASEEAKGVRGLCILKGRVKRFDSSGSSGSSRKIPHIGWNQLKISATKRGGSANNFGGKSEICPLLKSIPDNSYVYFCHSYYPQVKDKKIIATTTDYGTDFTSIVWQDNIYGVQFHPEKSQEVGLKILKNFVNEDTTYGAK